MKLIVGLGNPGKEYENTRHNAGFRFIDEFAKEKGIEINKEKFKYLKIEGLNATAGVRFTNQKFSYFFVPKCKQKTSFLFVLLQKYPSCN